MENPLVAPQAPINLKEYLLNYCKNLRHERIDEKPFYLSSTKPVSTEVEASCSLDLISLPDDNPINAFQSGSEIQRAICIQPNPDLPVPKTYKSIQEHKARSRHSAFSRTQFSHRLVTQTQSSPPKELSGNDYNLELTVRCYRPPRAHHRNLKLETPVFSEEFVCLGSNYLTELRDRISCICNGRRFVDISQNPDAPLPALDTNPGYFFINHTFYNDQRNPNNFDYSATVLKWACTAHGIKNENFEVKRMETTRFIDLTVSLGSPLQYLHHGNCEHLFVISQVEVTTTYYNRNCYPYLRSFNIYNRRTCYMCGLRGYDFIVEQSRRQLHDPSYLCRTCFFNFNYVNGQKVGEFKAYRIYDSSSEASLESQVDKEQPDSVNNEATQELSDFIEKELYDMD